MYCLEPVGSFPCGSCLPCRDLARRKLLARLALEYQGHGCGAFVTLTYDDGHCPVSCNNVPTLYARDPRLWLHRVRKHPVIRSRIERTRYGSLRYMQVGEYGSRTQRPHYHAILFGVPVDRRLEGAIAETWPAGFTAVARLGPGNMAYICKDLIKALPPPLQKPSPCCSAPSRTWSRRPILGAYGADRLIDMWNSRRGRLLLERYGDVRPFIRWNGQVLPLDLYLLNYIRRGVGVSEKGEERDSRWPVPEVSAEAMARSRAWAEKQEAKFDGLMGRYL